MQRSVILTAVVAVLGVAACSSGASAQGVGVDVYVGPRVSEPYYDYPPYEGNRYAPRVYGYYGDDTPRHLRQPEDYRAGSRTWWKQMDRTGRGGQSN